jgi:hypothetical protein
MFTVLIYISIINKKINNAGYYENKTIPFNCGTVDSNDNDSLYRQATFQGESVP